MTGIRSERDCLIMVTGAAGFIGYHLCQRLLDQGIRVVGLDNLNDYYDVKLKHSRLNLLLPSNNFTFLRGSIDDGEFILRAFAEHRPTVVVNLAAQAGVRFSLENPAAYVQSNIVGHFQILEACRRHPVKHLLYASSSSVYGGSAKVPFEESDRVDEPESFYAATKRADELMAIAYSHLYGIPTTGLRFFTVYGPLGRPDMAYFSFVDSYFANRPIRIYNDGDARNDLSRDFTYVDDVIEAMVRLLDRPPLVAPMHRIFNVGNNKPETLTDFVVTLERCLSRALERPITFEKTYEPLKPGDVRATYASTDLLARATGFRPHTTLEAGLQLFADWYVEHYGVA